MMTLGEKIFTFFAAVFGISVCATAFGGCLYLWPKYNVYASRLSGQAKLAESQAARLVLVSQAEAEKEAAQLRADAIAIVGKAAQDFPQYRTQEFIGAFAEALHQGKISQIIYVPTEANIPILEAGKR